MKYVYLITLLIGAHVHSKTNSISNFDALWDFNKPAETEIKFRNLVPETEATKDQDHLLQLMTQIARTQGLQRKFEEAHKTLDEVEKKLGNKTQVAEIRYNLERGRVFNSSKKPEQAMPFFTKAFELAHSLHQDNLAVDSAHMIAIAEPKPEKQTEWNLKAMDIAEKSKDPKAQNWLGSLYNNMGWTYHDSGKFDEAMGLFKKALAFRESKADATSIRIAKWCIARTHRSLKNYDEAIKIQLDLEKQFEKLPEKDGYVFEELGELYLVTSKADLAKKYFALAYDHLSKDEWFKANESKRLQRIKQLGGIS